MKAVMLLFSLAFSLLTQSLIGQVLPINEARVLAPGTQVSVIGTVTTFNFSTTGTQFFMQDESAGINVYSSTPVRFINDTLTVPNPRMIIYVSGEIAIYNGLVEIIPSLMEIINYDSGFMPDPIWVEGNQFTQDSELQGMRVIVTSAVLQVPFNPAATSSYNLNANDEFGYPFQVRVVKGGDLFSNPPEGNLFHLTGIMGSFNNGQLMLFNLADVEPLVPDTNTVFREVIFSVDMGLAIEYKQFDPIKNNVYLRGSFNSWDLSNVMVDPDMDGVFETSAILPEGEHFFKFFAEAVEFDWEDDPNRVIYVEGESLSFHDQFRKTFRDLRDSTQTTYDYQFRFMVDMTPLFEAGRFDPEKVFTELKTPAVSGMFSGWGAVYGDFFTEVIPDSVNPLVYTLVYDFPNMMAPNRLEYKFVLTDYMADKPIIMEWEGGPNRTLEINGTEPFNEFGHKVLQVNMLPEPFRVDSTTHQEENYDFVFTVDMTPLFEAGRFDPNQVFTEMKMPSVVGMFNYWTPSPLDRFVFLPDSSNPMIYKLIYYLPNMMVPNALEYKFVLADYSNPSEPQIIEWEAFENRTLFVEGNEPTNEMGIKVLDVNPNPAPFRAEQMPEFAFKMWLSQTSGLKGDTVDVFLWTESVFGEGVEAVEITLGYDYNLELVGVDNEYTFGGNNGWALDFNKDSLDTIVRVATTGSAVMYGAEPLIRFRFVILDDMHPYLWMNPMYPVVNEYNGWNIWVEGTSVEVIQTGIYPMGDVTMNGEVRALDAGYILKYLAGYMEFNEAQMVLANVSGDDDVSAYDASLILQYVVGKIYELPHIEPPLKVAGMASMKRTMEVADDLISVPITLQTEQDLFAFSASVTYDTEFLTYKGYILPETLTDFTVEVNVVDGEIKIIGAASTGVVLQADELLLQFEKAAELPAEGTNVVLSSLRLNEEETIQSVDSSIITPIISGLADKAGLPTSYALHQNYPNPFNPSTTLRYDLPESSEVSLVVFDVTGRRVALLVSAVQPAGSHQVLFNAAGLPSGLYFYELKTKEYSKVHKMMLIK